MKILRTIEAMSTINPQLCEQLTIQVEVEQSGEGQIPHVHVYHDKTRDETKCSYIRLDKAEYSPHHDSKGNKTDNKPLSKKLKREFISVMTGDWPHKYTETVSGVRIATGYEAAVDTWVDTYEHGDYSKFRKDENGNLIMPDYNKL